MYVCMYVCIYIYIYIYIRHFCDGPFCPDPVWKLSTLQHSGAAEVSKRTNRVVP